MISHQNTMPLMKNHSAGGPSVLTPDAKSSVIDKQLCEATKYQSDALSVIDEDTQHVEAMRHTSQRGRIELIMGPMFAGKSTELLRRVKRLEISGKKCLSIKYSADERYSKECISTHDK